MATQKSSPLANKLKAADPQIKKYVRALVLENSKLQGAIARLEVQNVSKDNRIKALENALPASGHDISAALERISKRMSAPVKSAR